MGTPTTKQTITCEEPVSCVNNHCCCRNICLKEEAAGATQLCLAHTTVMNSSLLLTGAQCWSNSHAMNQDVPDVHDPTDVAIGYTPTIRCH